MADVICSHVIAQVTLDFDYWDMMRVIDALVDKANASDAGGYEHTAKAHRELAKNILKAYMAEVEVKTPTSRLEQIEDQLASTAS